MCNFYRMGVYEDKLVELLGFLWVITRKMFFPKGSLNKWFENVWRWDGFVTGEEKMFSMSNIVCIVHGWFGNWFGYHGFVWKRGEIW